MPRLGVRTTTVGGIPVSVMIYVLDDDSAVLDSMQVLLESVGYRVRTFGGVAHFLKGLESAQATEHPSCVILDVHLPDGDGRALREHLAKVAPSLPVILMSGHSSADLAAEARATGAFAFLDKPISHADLFEAIERAIAT